MCGLFENTMEKKEKKVNPPFFIPVTNISKRSMSSKHMGYTSFFLDILAKKNFGRISLLWITESDYILLIFKHLDPDQ